MFRAACSIWRDTLAARRRVSLASFLLLHSAERGNLDNNLHEIGKDEADRIEARIRRSTTADPM